MNMEMNRTTAELVERGHLAQRQYAEAVAGQAKVKRQAFQAVVAYGQVLLEGRQAHSSNIAFSEWVSANGLDQGEPWDKQPERNCAQHIAQLVHSSGAMDAFADCPMSRPTHIMSWWRKLHPTPEAIAKAEAKAAAMNRAIEAAKEIEAAGEIVTEDKIAERAGVAAGTANKAATVVRKMKQARAEARVELDAERVLATAEAQMTPKSRITVEKAIELHKKRLNKAFEAVVDQEVRRRFESADKSVREHNAELRKRNQQLQIWIQEKAVFSTDDYRLIMVCLHPDNSASPEKRARAFDLFRQKERRLTGQ